MPKSKSAYSIPSRKQKSDTYIFVVWVDNESGVLARVVGLFSGMLITATPLLNQALGATTRGDDVGSVTANATATIMNATAR